MLTFDEKQFFGNHHAEPCCPPPTHECRSFPEKVEDTSRLLKNCLERLQMFEKSMEDRYNDLQSIMTRDNVTFKDLMQEAFSEFVSTVRAEVNLFETNTDNVVSLFKNAINKRLEDFNENFSQTFTAYKDSLDEIISRFENEIRGEFESYKSDVSDIIAEHVKRFDEQDAKISDAVAYMKSNLNLSIDNLLHEMQENGELVGVIESDVLDTVEKYGAAGADATDDCEAFASALAASKHIVLKPGKTYHLLGGVTVNSNTVIDGNGSTLIYTNVNNEPCFDLSDTENVTIKNLHIVNQGNGFGIACNQGTNNYSKNIVIENVQYERNPADETYAKENRGFFFGNVIGLTVRNCVLECSTSVSSGELSSAIIVWSDQNVNTNSKYINILDNRIKGFYRGVNMYGTGTGSAGNRQLVTIDNNVIERTNNEAIYCYHSPGAKITGNFILGCGKGIFADSSSDADHDGIISTNTYTNLVQGNTINECPVGLYMEELANGIVTENSFYACETAGIIVGGGSNYVKIANNTFRDCYDGVVLDMGYTTNSYHINAPEIDDNTFVKCKRHCIFSKSAISCTVKNNVFRLWGMGDTTDYGLQSSAIRIENKAGYRYITGNEFNNRVISTSDETKGNPYACISDMSCETFADLHICDNSFVNALAAHDINVANYSARRYFMNNRFDSTPVVSFQTGYETYYIHHNNNGITDTSM